MYLSRSFHMCWTAAAMLVALYPREGADEVFCERCAEDNPRGLWKPGRGRCKGEKESIGLSIKRKATEGSRNVRAECSSVLHAWKDECQVWICPFTKSPC
jgi:hypothetical protein